MNPLKMRMTNETFKDEDDTFQVQESVAFFYCV